MARIATVVRRVIGLVLLMVVLLGSPTQVRFAAFADPDGGYDVAVIEHLRVSVPEQAREAWLEAERGSWEPWLSRQEGFLGRDLLWDAETQEATLLIRWQSREQWKQIPAEEVETVQAEFERLARQATGMAQGNPFPLVFEGELLPQ